MKKNLRIFVAWTRVGRQRSSWRMAWRNCRLNPPYITGFTSELENARKVANDENVENHAGICVIGEAWINKVTNVRFLLD